MALPKALTDILASAYNPCVEFGGNCAEMRWDPNSGHVPRGFLSAAASPEDVELVLVFAEPGDPHERESHTGLESAVAYAHTCFGNGKDLFHRNVRKILNLCWPELKFDQQLKKVWLTESVLCSAKLEGGTISSRASRACGGRYLLPQLECFPNALVVALGSKAQGRLRALGFNSFLPAFAAAPPGCNRREALSTWEQIPLALKRRRKAGA